MKNNSMEYTVKYSYYIKVSNEKSKLHKVGDILPFLESQEIPDYWLECKGQILRIKDYQQLYILIGQRFAIKNLLRIRKRPFMLDQKERFDFGKLLEENGLFQLPDLRNE